MLQFINLKTVAISQFKMNHFSPSVAKETFSLDLLFKMCAQKLQKNIEDGNLLSKISLPFPMHLPKLASPFFVAPTLDGANLCCRGQLQQISAQIGDAS